MAVENTDAWKLLNGKISVPSDMRTAEWAMAPQWVRERSFYMAAVTRADILQEFRNEVELIANGQSGEMESLSRLQRFLDGTNYQPLPGQEGTIKDLRTSRRILTTLRTNVRLLRGWAQKERGMRPGPLRAFPAWELKRVRTRLKHRQDWQRVWLEQGGKIYEGRMIALKGSPIFAAIGTRYPDSMGVDYPPLRWGSGLGFEAVPRREVKAFGMLDDAAPAPAPRPVRSPNETLEVTPNVTTPAIREALEEHLQGLAEWQGDKLLFTDPNGTRPYSPDRLAEIWKRPMPEAFRDLRGEGQMQRESFLDWVGDSNLFWNDDDLGEIKQGRQDWWEDFQRVLMRLLPTGRESEPLFRGLRWNNNDMFSSFVERVRRDGYSIRPEKPAESWAASPQAAAKYTADGNYQVLLKLPAGHSAGRDVTPLVRAFADEVAKRESPQGKIAITDNEILLPSWAALQVKKIGRIVPTRTGKTVEIELEEAR